MAPFDEGQTMAGQNPSERLNPSFRPEDEHMAQELQPQVIGPPAYASPDPATLSNRLVAVEEHPAGADLSDDYGKGVMESYVADGAIVGTDHVASTRTPEELKQDDAAAKVKDAPADRKNWLKKDWQAQAAAHGLTTGGNTKQVKKRVEDFEGDVATAKDMKAEEWVSDIEGAKDADELAELRKMYGLSGSEYSTVADAFDAKQAEFNPPADDDNDDA